MALSGAGLRGLSLNTSPAHGSAESVTGWRASRSESCLSTGSARSVYTNTLHLACRKCNHWHNKTLVAIPRKIGFQVRVKCENCSYTLFALGGNSTQSTFASALTVQRNSSQWSVPPLDPNEAGPSTSTPPHPVLHSNPFPDNLSHITEKSPGPASVAEHESETADVEHPSPSQTRESFDGGVIDHILPTPSNGKKTLLLGRKEKVRMRIRAGLEPLRRSLGRLARKLRTVKFDGRLSTAKRRDKVLDAVDLSAEENDISTSANEMDEITATQLNLENFETLLLPQLTRSRSSLSSSISDSELPTIVPEQPDREVVIRDVNTNEDLIAASREATGEAPGQGFSRNSLPSYDKIPDIKYARIKQKRIIKTRQHDARMRRMFAGIGCQCDDGCSCIVSARSMNILEGSTSSIGSTSVIISSGVGVAARNTLALVPSDFLGIGQHFYASPNARSYGSRDSQLSTCASEISIRSAPEYSAGLQELSPLQGWRISA
ncbi:hypothetical protein L228DRAFT_266418 [Xylona heveae TC161]|uniref:Uncharacterized protein n=1 Tax=Xylona heveae (strain CBS 132557 / TC161) TaxID=1328760 RepID=A0A165HX81_XYLHT|nr:hypothetical protein L228DRAFT_266418 [Xylona heveae TC161]KZF24054.1 hypothetical protein L228DRAFT_266418 [Xylona heveae TC161]